MRILLIHPTYHAAGAEIAGDRPPALVAYLAGQLKTAGYKDLRFNDAMTDHLEREPLEAILRAEKPDVVMCTAITPAKYKVQETMALVKKIHPNCVTVLGGIHGTFMYGQVLTESSAIDYIIRGEGEEIVVKFVKALDEGRLPRSRDDQGSRLHEGREALLNAGASAGRRPRLAHSRLERARVEVLAPVSHA